MQLDYVPKQLHVDALRLGSIFEYAVNYPEHYFDITNSSKVDPHIAEINRFRFLLKDL